MAAGGMNRGVDGGRPTLAGRRRGPVPPPSATRPEDDGRPCWLVSGSAEVAGTVHGWRQLDRGDDASGPADHGWEALVVAWVPQRVVRPRDP